VTRLILDSVSSSRLEGAGSASEGSDGSLESLSIMLRSYKGLSSLTRAASAL
jgi:hypothetical protein